MYARLLIYPRGIVQCVGVVHIATSHDKIYKCFVLALCASIIYICIFSPYCAFRWARFWAMCPEQYAVG